MNEKNAALILGVLIGFSVALLALVFAFGGVGDDGIEVSRWTPEQQETYYVDCDGDHSIDRVLVASTPTVDAAETKCFDGTAVFRVVPADVHVYDEQGNLVAEAGDER